MSINNQNERLTIGTILGKTVPYLAKKGLPNPKLEADLMLAAVLDLPRVKLYSDWEKPLEQYEVDAYRQFLAKRLQGCPLAYLTGKKSFLSWDFKVTADVLIPRPETELLVETVVERFKDYKALRGVDVGTGSGILAVSLAKLLPDSNWIGVDLSAAAVAVAAENAMSLGVADRVTICHGDLLEAWLGQEPGFDLIVSNPPYIPEAEIDNLQPEVRQEPRLALTGGVDGLDIYRKLVPQGAVCLKTGGILAVEHGYDQREALLEIFTNNGFEVEALRDLSGLDRVIIGVMK